MTNRTYRTVLGLMLLLVLYFELSIVMYGIIALLFIEGITNQLMPKVLSILCKCATKQAPVYINPELEMGAKFSMDAERVWRLAVGGFLLISYSLFDFLWFFPWFMGFAIFGAGLSGVCPVLFAIRWLGFK